jgi:hypothetical protein
MHVSSLGTPTHHQDQAEGAQTFSLGAEGAPREGFPLENDLIQLKSCINTPTYYDVIG